MKKHRETRRLLIRLIKETFRILLNFIMKENFFYFVLLNETCVCVSAREKKVRTMLSSDSVRKKAFRNFFSFSFF